MFGSSAPAHRLLSLLRLADSALPIGSLSHSFGLETLAANGQIDVAGLPALLADYLTEVGLLETAFCLRAAEDLSTTEWPNLNSELSALLPAWESRKASITLGRRFQSLVAALEPSAADPRFLLSEVHLCTAFGRAGRVLTLEAPSVALAFLHQNLAGLLSACQRLMPLGQQEAATILWNLKARMVDTVEAAEAIDYRDATCFTPALEIASMGHPFLPTRLFIS